MFSAFSKKFSNKIRRICHLDISIRNISFFNHIDLPFFCEQLACLLETGYTLPEILPGMETAIDTDVLHGLVAIVKRGKGLEAAMRVFPEHFPQDLVCLVAIGEQTGFLESVLIDYATQARERSMLLKKIRKALFYPALILAAGVLLIIYTVTMVLPSFQTIFTDMGVKVPLVTAVMLSASQFLRQYYLAIFSCLAGAIILARMTMKSGQFRTRWAAWLWKLRFVKLFWMSRMFRLLGMFLSVGIPLESALSTAKKMITNPVFRRKWERLSILCRQGHAFHRAAKMCKLPGDACSLLKSMEGSGRLVDGLRKCAEYQQAEMENCLDNATSLLEPAVILLVGGIVGLIVFSLFSPLMVLTRQMM